jgi:broad specificity phosphatase PhoE
MKWPTELVIVRHAQSDFNILRGMKSSNPLYQKFVESFNSDHRSAETMELAREVRTKFTLGVSDADTGITLDGCKMAMVTGKALKQRLGEVPHVIYVSPYYRARQTLMYMASEWPSLNDVKTVTEDRIREQEHGLSLLYNDWRVFQVMHPEQKELRELQGPYWYQYPQGESVSQVRDRIRSFLGTLIREHAGQRVMLVTHHLTILSIRATLERLSPESFIHLDEMEKPVNCGVTIYRGDPSLGRRGKLLLREYNAKLY